MPASLFSLLPLPVHYSGKNLNNDKAPKEFSVAKSFLKGLIYSLSYTGVRLKYPDEVKRAPGDTCQHK